MFSANTKEHFSWSSIKSFNALDILVSLKISALSDIANNSSSIFSSSNHLTFLTFSPKNLVTLENPFTAVVSTDVLESFKIFS